MKRVSSAFRHRALAISLGATALLAGVAGLRAAQQVAPTPAGDKPAAGTCETPSAAACCRPASLLPACATTSHPPAAAALRAGIDPETGLLGMPADPTGKAFDLPLAQTPLPAVQTRADGTQLLHVQGHFRNLSMVRVGADGKLETECTTDAGLAQQFLRGDAATVTKPVSQTAAEVQ